MSRRHQAAIVVIGDIGRSPRMCYHAHSLATHVDYDVKIIGYLDTLPHPIIDSHPNISYLPLPSPPDCLTSLPEIIALPLKILWIFTVLFWTLMFKTSLTLKLILMQNPPALPAMAVCWMVSRIKGSKWVIDWHNYTYSVLRDKWKMEQFPLPRLHENEPDSKINNLSDSKKRLTKEEREAVSRERKKSRVEKKERKSPRRRFIEFTYNWEGWFGRRADAGLCVTRTMQKDLYNTWGVPAAAFHDRPPSFTFKHVSDEDKHSLFTRLSRTDEGRAIFKGVPPLRDAEQYTRFTYQDSSGVYMRESRPLLVISSTSWTPDEDFHILLEALMKYDQVAKLARSSCEQTSMAHIVCAVTGRGPEKEYYAGKIEKLRLENVQIITPWLEAEDYPRLLAAADIGVSLHTSTSGLDLPMKIVDMFGAGIPVLAKRFACLHELVQEGHNGKMFDTAHELSVQLQQLGTGHPKHNETLHDLKRNVTSDELASWEDHWSDIAMKVLEPDLDVHFERTMAR